MNNEIYKKVPTHIDLMGPTLNALKVLGGSGTIEEIFDKIIELEKYSEEIQKVPHLGGRRSELEYRACWARTYLKKAGAINNSGSGIWSLTDLGEKRSLEEILDRSKQNVREYRLNKSRQAEHVLSVSGMGAEDEMEEEFASNWKTQLLSTIIKIEPSAFERLSQRVLRESGFIKVQVTGKSGDGGIDGIGVLRINLLSFQVFFQCKRYKGSVGAGAVRDFRGAMAGRSDKGLIITTGSLYFRSA